MEQIEPQNKMAVTPIRKLMLAMGAPIVVSMLMQALYNIVDSAFVANMKENGEAALNALTLAFPLQMLMVAIGIGTGVGANALLSKSLGQGDSKKVNRTAGNAIFLGIVIFVIFLLFGIFGVKMYISTQTSNPLIAEMAVDYLRINMVVSFGLVFFNIFEKLLQAAGHSTYSTIAQIAGAVTNIVLDPIMIYGWCGLPEMGVKGAAYATVLGQIVSFLLSLLFHIRVSRNVSIHPKYWKPSGKIIKEIYTIGLPAIIAQALMSVMTYGMNIILGGIQESMVTAYGLYYKIQQFVMFAAFGLRDAITPIVSFNHGMGNRRRIRDGIRYGMLYTLIVMAIGLIIVEILAGTFSHAFGLSGDANAYFMSAVRIISISFLFAGANVAFQGIFQALDGGLESLIVSVCRQVIFIFPFAIWFAHIAKSLPEYSWLVWITFLIAETLSLIIACVLFKRIYRKKVLILTA